MAQLYHTLMKDLKKAVPKMGYKFKDKAGEDLFFFLLSINLIYLLCLLWLNHAYTVLLHQICINTLWE